MKRVRWFLFRLPTIILLVCAVACSGGKNTTINYYITDDDGSPGDDDGSPGDDDGSPADDDGSPADDDQSPGDDDDDASAPLHCSADGTVCTDPFTGLMWQNGASVGANYLDWTAAQNYCAALTWGGYGGWRLPGLDELRSLIRGCPATQTGGSCGVTDECLSWSGCANETCGGCPYLGGPGTGGAYWPPGMSGAVGVVYWSSSTVADIGKYVWEVGFNLGNLSYNAPGYGFSTRCVRGSPDDDDDDASPDDDDDDDTFACDVVHPDSTVGLLSCLPGAANGYTLFAPFLAETTYLIDMVGRVVHTWPSQYLPGDAVYLTETGQLLRTGNVLNDNFPGGGQGGIVMLQNWGGDVAWSYVLSTSEVCAHHDVRMLPNGDVLLIVWEKIPGAEAVAAGRNPSTLPAVGLWADYYVEIAPVGTNDAEIVWLWRAWDHLIQDYDPTQANYGVVADHPELIDVNYDVVSGTDWMHTNSIDYNPDFDQILVSVHEFSEVWVIDHSTTTAEAASHSGGAYGRGGDLLYRWGNPTTYRQTSPAQDFYEQHNARWVADGLPGAGHITVFNNGLGRPAGQYSSADEFAPAVNPDGSYPAADPAYAPANLFWTFAATPMNRIYSAAKGSAQRLANGNTLICVGDAGAIMEVTPAGAVVWQFVSPVTEAGVIPQGTQVPLAFEGLANMTFSAHRYAPDYPGLAGQDLTPGPCLVEPCE